MRAEIREIAKSKMHTGYNCCQAVLLACDECFELALSAEFVAASKFFGGGIKSGCVCGALAGLIMAAGILDEKYPHHLGKDLAAQVHKHFCEKFGSACCREIRGNRPFWAKMGNKSCRELTGAAAEILCDLWAGKIKTANM